MTRDLHAGRTPHGPLFASLLLAAVLPGLAHAAGDERSFEIYGFAQADAIYDSKRVDPNWNDAFRPSKIGVDDQFGTNGESSVSAKQSRFGVKGSLPTGNYGPIDFKFEFDLFGTGANAGQTTFRLRHAYAEWNAILAGQTNSLFMDGDVFPNVIDYWGPTGLVFLRNPQLRWTPYRTAGSHFSIAIEKPSNDVDPGNIRLIQGLDNFTLQSNEPLPDLTAQWRLGSDWGHVQVAGLLRDVGFQYQTTADSGWHNNNETGWGINLSSSIRTVGKDQILLQVVHGDGIASYMNDGGMDLAPQNACANQLCGLHAKAVPLTGVVAYYDHYWNSLLSSSIGYSFTSVNNTNFQDPATFHRGDYGSVNLLAYPTDNVLLGGEVLYGKRTNNNGATGDDFRVQFSVKYNFGIKL